jgi:hypothetical protein
MTARQFTRLTAEQCAEMADVRIAACRPELISGFIRDGTHPADARQLLAKPTTNAEPLNSEQLNPLALEELVAERFTFASLSGEREITR